MKGIIYRAVNIITHMYYIGQTTKTLEERRKQHRKLYKYYPFRFYDAIREYGFDSFRWETLKEIGSDDVQVVKDGLNYWEKYYIGIYRSCVPEIGYNDTTGSRRGSPTQRIRDKISRAQRGKKGRPHTEEEKRRQSERQKGRKTSPSFSINMKRTLKNKSDKKKSEMEERYEEICQDIKKGLVFLPTQNGCSKAKYVICMETKQIYNSIRVAAHDKDLSEYGISQSCHSGGVSTCGGYSWMFFREERCRVY